jgi:hypothetical protein
MFFATFASAIGRSTASSRWPRNAELIEVVRSGALARSAREPAPLRLATPA